MTSVSMFVVTCPTPQRIVGARELEHSVCHYQLKFPSTDSLLKKRVREKCGITPFATLNAKIQNKKRDSLSLTESVIEKDT